jgi:prepilin-type N-terminal cleavage/methylation domain-containing protein
MTGFFSTLSNQLKGFTLVELLMVIAIISLLSSVIFSAVNETRSKARDATRISDLAQIRRALELYYDEWGKYPSPTVSSPFVDNTKYTASTNNSGKAWKNGAGTLGDNLSNYIDLPIDPINTPSTGAFPWINNNYAYMYIVDTDRLEYELIANLENEHSLACINYGQWPFHLEALSIIGTDWCGLIFGTTIKIFADH